MKDQLNRVVSITTIPTRIVSLVPSQTELLYDLGLEEEVVGITKFCVHPHVWLKSKTRIGGTKKVNFKAIHALLPDIIFANKEENSKEDIDELAKHYPVWISDIATVEDALQMIHSIGQIVGKPASALQIGEDIGLQYRNWKATKKYSALYLIWRNPFIAAGKGTFIHEMMSIAGFENIIMAERYPEINLEAVRTMQPDLIMLSSEPFPFKQKHIMEVQVLLPNSRIILVDGELFSWYGSRMLKSFDYFRALHEQIK